MVCCEISEENLFFLVDVFQISIPAVYIKIAIQ